MAEIEDDDLSQTKLSQWLARLVGLRQAMKDNVPSRCGNASRRRGVTRDGEWRWSDLDSLPTPPSILRELSQPGVPAA